VTHFDLIDWNAVALGVVQTLRVPMYSEPRLIKGTGRRTGEGRKAPDVEHKRRKGIRGLNEELSKYYQLAANQTAWGCPDLPYSFLVLSDVEGLPKPLVNPYA